MRKYIRLYEEYTDLEEKSLERHYSWSDIRDTLQLKLPFIIIDFKSVSSRDECIKRELFDEKYTKQKFYSKKTEDDTVKYPSVFILGEGSNLSDRVLDLIKRFDIIRIVVGEYGKEHPQLYVDGDQVELGRNLQTSNTIDDMDLEDFYEIDSKFYKFIG